jgi:4-methylaminobutanoate oxidase (formaldehyde-forming)
MIHADQSIDDDYIASGTWEVNIAGRLYPAEVSLKPMYDAGMERIKV